MQIQLTPDIEAALLENARHQGALPETLALDILRGHLISAPALRGDAEKTEGSLADYLEDHIGVLSSSEHVPGGAQFSENCGGHFSKILMKKRRQGKL